MQAMVFIMLLNLMTSTIQSFERIKYLFTVKLTLVLIYTQENRLFMLPEKPPNITLE